jgi:hypothetical protein
MYGKRLLEYFEWTINSSSTRLKRSPETPSTPENNVAQLDHVGKLINWNQAREMAQSSEVVLNASYPDGRVTDHQAFLAHYRA